jgi:two-component system, chemotaxis family, response regulator Rcp1
MEAPAEFRIWLAEDNPGDVRLFREALNSRGFPFDLTVAEDGQKAIALVRSLGNSGGAARPHLIVLDVNLPRHNGDEVLLHIRNEAALDRIPVIVLTSSASPTDHQTADKLGANLYIQKPSDLDGLMTIGTLIENLLLSRDLEQPVNQPE